MRLRHAQGWRDLGLWAVCLALAVGSGFLEQQLAPGWYVRSGMPEAVCRFGMLWGSYWWITRQPWWKVKSAT